MMGEAFKRSGKSVCGRYQVRIQRASGCQRTGYYLTQTVDKSALLADITSAITGRDSARDQTGTFYSGEMK
jgi:hypothetical protein